jgi:hypothetical protein
MSTYATAWSTALPSTGTRRAGARGTAASLCAAVAGDMTAATHALAGLASKAIRSLLCVVLVCSMDRRRFEVRPLRSLAAGYVGLGEAVELVVSG